jgi:hypothetical protein
MSHSDLLLQNLNNHGRMLSLRQFLLKNFSQMILSVHSMQPLISSLKYCGLAIPSLCAMMPFTGLIFQVQLQLLCKHALISPIFMLLCNFLSKALPLFFNKCSN